MNHAPTASQLELAAVDPTTALGPEGMDVTIAGVPCHVTRGNGHGHVIVTDDRGTHHDYNGVTWWGIKQSMEDYFEVVRVGV